MSRTYPSLVPLPPQLAPRRFLLWPHLRRARTVVAPKFYSDPNSISGYVGGDRRLESGSASADLSTGT